MPGKDFREHRYGATECKAVLGTVTSDVTSVTVWNAASTNKVRVVAYQLIAVVTATLDKDEAAGNIVGLWDNAATVPLVIMGVVNNDDLVAGSSWPGAQIDTAIETTAATAVPSFSDVLRPVILPRTGVVTATAGNDILFGLSTGAAFVDVHASTGAIVIAGRIWGTEAVTP